MNQKNFVYSNKLIIQGLETRLEVVKSMEETYSEDDLISLVNNSSIVKNICCYIKVRSYGFPAHDFSLIFYFLNF